MNVYQFGATELPGAVAEWDDTLEARRRTVETLGGHYNAYRGSRAPLKLPRALNVNALVLAASRSALGVKLDALRGLVGARDRLWLKPYDEVQADRWAWATLTSVADRGKATERIWQPVTLAFEVESGWNGSAHGGAWTLDSGYYFDNGLYFDTGGSTLIGYDSTPFLANPGNRMVTNCGITYTCNEALGLTAVTMTTGNTEFTFGPSVFGDVWIIDCGAQTVLKNGADAYAYFALTASHASVNWFEISAGGETVTISGGGADDTVQYTYSDGWA